jgi:hypothetical protein
LSLRSNRDRRNAPGVRLLRPNRGLAPRRAVCLFGQIATDATLQACAYSGPIVASLRVERFVSSVKSRPTQRSRRALTPAQSWPRSASSGLSLRSNHDRRNAPGVRLLRPSVASLRVERFVSSVTTISDRLGARAPQASAPRLSLTAPKATSETRPPSKAVA